MEIHASSQIDKLQLSPEHFPSLQEVSRLHFEPLAVACDISFILIGRFDCFGFVFATLSRKALE